MMSTATQPVYRIRACRAGTDRPRSYRRGLEVSDERTGEVLASCDLMARPRSASSPSPITTVAPGTWAPIEKSCHPGGSSPIPGSRRWSSSTQGSSASCSKPSIEPLWLCSMRRVTSGTACWIPVRHGGTHPGDRSGGPGSSRVRTVGWSARAGAHPARARGARDRGDSRRAHERVANPPRRLHPTPNLPVSRGTPCCGHSTAPPRSSTPSRSARATTAWMSSTADPPHCPRSTTTFTS